MSDSNDLDLARQHFVETMGRIAKRHGLPAIAGKIAGLLYLTPGELSAEELKKQLSVSSGSISSNTTLLEEIGTIVRVVPKRGRQHYFRSAPEATIRTLKRDIERYDLDAEETAAASALVRANIKNLPQEVDQKMHGIERLFRGMSFYTQKHIAALDAEQKQMTKARGAAKTPKAKK